MSSPEDPNTQAKRDSLRRDIRALLAIQAERTQANSSCAPRARENYETLGQQIEASIDALVSRIT